MSSAQDRGYRNKKKKNTRIVLWKSNIIEKLKKKKPRS